jgi:hypothetical protein
VAAARPCRVLDISGGGHFAGQLTAAGHEVLSVDHPLVEPSADPPPEPGPGRLVPVGADSRSLDRLEAGCVDLVLAESSALSLCLATEPVVEQLTRVLRPGGRMLLVVESLMLGLARLAEQGRWAELADAPSADVVLVPDADGGITRCFWPEELHALLDGAGLEVEWVRPRSVLSVADRRAGAPAGRRRGAAHAGQDRAGPGRRARGRVHRPVPARQRAPPLRDGARAAAGR